MKTSKYNYFVKKGENYICYNTMTQGIIEFNKLYYGNIIDFNPSFFDEYELDLLKKHGILIDDHVDEDIIIDDIRREKKYKNKDLYFTLELTNLCNFRCVYCYQEHVSRVLNKANIDSFYRYILEYTDKNEVNSLCIHWFGGEPLLNVDIAYNLDQKLKKYCNTKGIKYYSQMTTNGYLIDKYYEDYLSKMSIDMYTITLDGCEEIHNKSRPLKGGDPTFEKIVSNIKVLMQNNKHILIRYNVNYKNKNIDNFLKYLEAKDILHNKNIKLSFNITVDMDCSNKVDKYYFENVEKYAEVLKNIYETLFKNEVSLPRFSVGGLNCKFASKNNFVVNSDLSICRCSANEPDLDFKFGKIIGGDISIKEENQFKDGFSVAFSDKCKECILKPICKGGCPLLDLKGMNNCFPEKYFFDDYVRMIYEEETRNI